MIERIVRNFFLEWRSLSPRESLGQVGVNFIPLEIWGFRSWLVQANKITPFCWNGCRDLCKKIKALWREVISSIHSCSQGRLWFDIAENSFMFFNFVTFKIRKRNGNRIKLWKDMWVGSSSLEASFLDLFNNYTKKEATVAECWDMESNDWDLGFRGGIRDRIW